MIYYEKYAPIKVMTTGITYTQLGKIVITEKTEFSLMK